MFSMKQETVEDLWLRPEDCVYCGVMQKNCRCKVNLEDSLARVFSTKAVVEVAGFKVFSTSMTDQEVNLAIITARVNEKPVEREEPINLEDDAYAESRVIETTKELWSKEEDQHERFMREVNTWAWKYTSDKYKQEEMVGEAMLKYAELLITHPDQPLGYYMTAIMNNNRDIARDKRNAMKNTRKGATYSFREISLDNDDSPEQVGYYDTYSFEYDMELTKAEENTVEELVEWENAGGENLRQENLKLYKKVVKVEKAKSPEVEQKRVVFYQSSKAIDLRDDAATQKSLSSDVTVRKQNSLEVLISKTRKKRTHTITPVNNESASEMSTEGKLEYSRPTKERFTVDGQTDYPAFRKAVKAFENGEGWVALAEETYELNW